MKQITPVNSLLNLVWENSNESTAHSWERLNHSMSDALRLCIGSGFEFEPDDFKSISSQYSFGRWCGDVERLYALAIAVENTTAVKSFENWKQREPIIADDVAFQSNDGYTHINDVRRERERLAVGFSFMFRGHLLRVNTFAADGSYINAGRYERVPDGEYSREKLAQRFKISRQDIIDARAETKERTTLIARLSVAPEAARKALKKIGCANDSAVQTIDLAKLRKIADEVAPTGGAA